MYKKRFTFLSLNAFTALCVILLLWGITQVKASPHLRRKPVSVLCYHDINITPTNLFTRTPEQLARDFSRLKDEGIKIVPLDTLVQALQTGGKWPENWASITFDDASKGQFDFARPLLKRYNFPATFFVPTKSVVSNTPVSDEYSGVMTWKELKILQKEGFSLESHSHAHHSYARQNPAQIEKDIGRSLNILHDNLGITSRDLCLPYGEYQLSNEHSFLKMKIRSIVLTTTDHGDGLKSIVKIHRFEVKSTTSQDEILAKIKPI